MNENNAHHTGAAAAPGLATIDYALILVLVALAAFTALRVTGVSVAGVMCRAYEGLGGDVEMCDGETAEAPADPGEEEEEDDRLLFVDDFDDPALSQWTNTRSWDQRGSAICSRSDNDVFLLMYAPDSHGTDYTITSKAVSMESNGSFTIFFRSQGTSGDTYGFYYHKRAGRDYAYLVEWRRGHVVYPLLATAFVDSKLELGREPRQVEVVVEGNTLSATIDGSRILTASDVTYGSGGVGLGVTGRTEACVQDIRVEGKK